MGLESAEARAQAAFSRLEAALDGALARERGAADPSEARRAQAASASREAVAKLDAAIARLRGIVED